MLISSFPHLTWSAMASSNMFETCTLIKDMHLEEIRCNILSERVSQGAMQEMTGFHRSKEYI